MAWSEASAWLQGTAQPDLYQQLLDDAPEYRPSVVLTPELVAQYMRGGT